MGRQPIVQRNTIALSLNDRSGMQRGKFAQSFEGWRDIGQLNGRVKFSIRNAPFYTMAAGNCDGLREAPKKFIHLFDRPAGDDREPSVQKLAKRAEKILKYPIHNHKFRSVYQINERAIEIDEEAGPVEQVDRW